MGGLISKMYKYKKAKNRKTNHTVEIKLAIFQYFVKHGLPSSGTE